MVIFEEKSHYSLDKFLDINEFTLSMIYKFRGKITENDSKGEIAKVRELTLVITAVIFPQNGKFRWETKILVGS